MERGLRKFSFTKYNLDYDIIVIATTLKEAMNKVNKQQWENEVEFYEDTTDYCITELKMQKNEDLTKDCYCKY